MTRKAFLQQLPDLVKNYTPAPDVLAHIKNVNLLMVIGPSGAGKTTLIQRSGLPFVPSDTTRQPRIGEKEELDFYFRSDYETIASDIKAGRFVQIVRGVEGDFYATKASSYPSKGMAVMPPLADAIPTFRQLGFAGTISAFITPPSYQEWMRRMKTHKMSETQLAKRLNEAKRSFDFALHDQQVHFILNDNLTEATNQLKDLVAGKVNAALERTGRETATILLGSV